MNAKLVAACIQLNNAPDIAANLERIEPMIRLARERGADFIALPENAALMIAGRTRLFANSPPESEHSAVAFFARMAQSTGAWILAGRIGVATGRDRLANRSFLFDPRGEVAARYDKIHMFDAVLSEKESYRESDHYSGGKSAVVAETPWGKVGLTICYDVRFPQLYRALAKAGANIIAIPAAFTVTTGRLHWHVLTRARAIETGCFVVAPAQCGEHDGRRQTYWHSLIIAPDGVILAEAGTEPGIIVAELDLAKVAEARRMLPCLEHDREFESP
jgi:predicted amidohydrolase